MGETGGGASERFRTTRWSMVQAAGGEDPERARAALEDLCATYWFPLYAYARRSGLAPEAAEDCTQGFFARLLSRGDLARVEITGGRFRSFLLVALRNYIASEREREGALKRGGGARCGKGALRGQGLRGPRRRRDGVPVQRVTVRRFGGPIGCDRLHCPE